MTERKKDEMMKDLATNLSALRHIRGLTTVEVAEFTGIDEYLINGYELSLCTPTVFEIYMLAQVYNVGLDELFDSKLAKMWHDLEDYLENK